ncbi:MAG: nitrogenase iron protein [Deltaproteobacteria bacterium]|nr:MAG: nitrogenase iron protein [Deltaproteobacteria bacterium]
MKQIAFYGKGGVGKSTIASNIAAALSKRGLSVMMVGCDPKHNCTMNLRGGAEIPTILDVLREKGIEKKNLEELTEGKEIEITDIIYKGYNGIYCAECGGPKPGFGCAGRGVLVAVDFLKRLNVFEELKLDVVIYDVLGDVVCGGFAMPLRVGLADVVYIITSADYLALYAANNICMGIREFGAKGGSPLGGIIYNVRGALDEEDVVQEFARRVGTRIIGKVPNSQLIVEAEVNRCTVIEYAANSDISNLFSDIAWNIYENSVYTVPNPLSSEDMTEVAHILRTRIRERFGNYNDYMKKHSL